MESCPFKKLIPSSSNLKDSGYSNTCLNLYQVWYTIWIQLHPGTVKIWEEICVLLLICLFWTSSHTIWVVKKPATFWGYINFSLQHYLDILYITYLDDILINFLDLKTNKNNVRYVLKQLVKHGLFVNFLKYLWSVFEIGFLHFVHITKSVQMKLSRIETIKEWLEPSSVQNI